MEHIIFAVKASYAEYTSVPEGEKMKLCQPFRICSLDQEG